MVEDRWQQNLVFGRRASGFLKPLAGMICLFWILLVSACAGRPGFRVDPLPAYDALFERRQGWTGADGAYSLALSEDSLLWMFGDTWVGEIRNGAHVEAVIVNNSLAVQTGIAPGKAALDFYFSRTAGGRPAAFFGPDEERGWFWIYHGVRTRRGLYLFLVQIEPTEAPPSAGFEPVGTWLVHVANPLDSPDHWRVTRNRIPWENFTSRGATFFGSWILKKGSWIYVYGTTEEIVDGFHRKYMILARVSEEDLSRFDRWRFYVKGKWSSDFSAAERLCADIANEFSVSFLDARGKWVAVYSAGGLGRHISARFAPNPWGPWSDPRILYHCPEMQWGKDIFCYAAKAHPALAAAADEIIITYVANSTDFYKMAADTRLYRPRFLRAIFPP